MIVTIRPCPDILELVEAARTALRNLLDARDFLGYQLSHAHGCMTDEQFSELSQDYLSLVQRSDDELTRRTAALVTLLGDRVDSDTVAVAFKCDLDQASRALTTVARAK